jgi:hypothetical protein
MNEGTMHPIATAPRLARLLACAAVPVMLVAGCSSGSKAGSEANYGGGSPSSGKAADTAGTSGTSGTSDTASGTAASPEAEASPTLVPVAYTKLPEACNAIAAKTIDSLVPKAEDRTGKAGTSSDAASRASCTWNGLKDDGLKGSQYRWLDISLLRFDSATTAGDSGNERATKQFTKQVADTQATDGAKNAKVTPLTGIGDQASLVSFDTAKSDEDFRNRTVVVRSENAVITLNYNGAGFAGGATPDGADLAKKAENAAKEAVTAITSANPANAT